MNLGWPVRPWFLLPLVLEKTFEVRKSHRFLRAGRHSCQPMNSVKALKELEALTPNSDLASCFLIYCWAPEGMGIAPLTLGLRRQYPLSTDKMSYMKLLWCTKITCMVMVEQVLMY